MNFDVKKEDCLPYRLGVGMVVYNAQGRVWLGRRFEKNICKKSDMQTLWQFPQGGVEEKENLLVAAKRELFEETSMISLDLVGEYPNWLRYDFPKKIASNCLEGKYRGQQQKWYAFTFCGDDSEINLTPEDSNVHQEFADWCWCPIENVLNQCVVFKIKIYKKVLKYFDKLIKVSS